jgi:excisionase family DNA binding protein
MQETIFTNMTKADFQAFIRGVIKEALTFQQEATTVAPQKDKLLNIDEVCSLLKISKPTLHNWKRDGRLPFHRIGSKVYFKEKEVLEAMKGVKVKRW